MSQTTSSPARDLASPGSACGWAPLAPAATIAENAGSAPSSRILRLGGAGDLDLAAADDPVGEHVLVDLVGEPRRLGDRGDLALVLAGGAAARRGRWSATSSTPSPTSSSSLRRLATLVAASS